MNDRPAAPSTTTRLTQTADQLDYKSLTIRHALKIMELVQLLREARDSRAADIVGNGWADRVDAALQEHQ